MGNTSSPVNLEAVVNSPDMTITTNVKLDHVLGSWEDLFETLSVLLVDILWLSILLKPDIVSVVDTPKNWAMAD